MVVAGPNGSGKSTLLNAIRASAGYTNIMYVGPHRAMRKQVVQQRHLMTQAFSLETFLSSQSVSGVEGIRIFDGSRDPWGYDESANYLKHTLCQIEVDRLQAIANRVDREGEILKGSLIDPWKPLRELTNNLLPHMAFERIDATNRDQVRVLFRVHRLDVLVDLDELSSGEKSIVQMFYPLVERDIKALVREIDTGPHSIDRPASCVLIDEPELHLQPLNRSGGARELETNLACWTVGLADLTSNSSSRGWRRAPRSSRPSGASEPAHALALPGDQRLGAQRADLPGRDIEHVETGADRGAGDRVAARLRGRPARPLAPGLATD